MQKFGWSMCEGPFPNDCCSNKEECESQRNKRWAIGERALSEQIAAFINQNWPTKRICAACGYPAHGSICLKQAGLELKGCLLEGTQKMTETAAHFCCDEFAFFANRGPVQFEQSNDNAWNVKGCCNGGCYVLSDIKFCPFCGSKLSAKAMS